MNTATDELTPEERAGYEHVTARHEELVARLPYRTGPLNDAGAYVADVILYTLMRLHDEERPTTGASGEVMAFIDEVTAVLHDIRNEAVQEHRRRTDAAMARTDYLEGDAR